MSIQSIIYFCQRGSMSNVDTPWGASDLRPWVSRGYTKLIVTSQPRLAPRCKSLFVQRSRVSYIFYSMPRYPSTVLHRVSCIRLLAPVNTPNDVLPRCSRGRRVGSRLGRRWGHGERILATNSQSIWQRRTDPAAWDMAYPCFVACHRIPRVTANLRENYPPPWILIYQDLRINPPHRYRYQNL